MWGYVSQLYIYICVFILYIFIECVFFLKDSPKLLTLCKNLPLVIKINTGEFPVVVYCLNPCSFGIPQIIFETATLNTMHVVQRKHL